MSRSEHSSQHPHETELGFDRRNYVLFAVALATIVIGWIALGKGSITFAPIVLVIGYCVLVPAALLVGIRDDDRAD